MVESQDQHFCSLSWSHKLNLVEKFWFKGNSERKNPTSNPVRRKWLSVLMRSIVLLAPPVPAVRKVSPHTRRIWWPRNPNWFLPDRRGGFRLKHGVGVGLRIHEFHFEGICCETNGSPTVSPPSDLLLHFVFFASWWHRTYYFPDVMFDSVHIGCGEAVLLFLFFLKTTFFFFFFVFLFFELEVLS